MGTRFATGLALVLAIAAASSSGQVAQADDYSHAEGLVRSHQWDQGIEALQPLLKTSPNVPKLLNLAGLAYTGKRDLFRADEYFRLALRSDPAFVPALKNLGVNELTVGDVSHAREHLLAAARIVPDDPVVNLYLGEIYFRQQDFKACAEHLRRAGAIVQRDPNLLARLAVAELKAGDPERALKTLADDGPPSLTPQTQAELGIALAQSDLHQQAIPYLEAARVSYPGLVDISYDLALSYISLKRYKDAIGALDVIVANGHETPEIDELIAEAYESNRQTQQAVDVLRRSIALDPKSENSYIEFASICLDHQDFKNADKVIGVGLTSLPRSARLMTERGILEAMQDHFEAAEKDFEAAAKLRPADNSAYLGLGVTLLETGDAERAVGLLRKRLREHPNDANLCYLLAEALLRTGAQVGDPAFTEAQSLLERAVRVDPKLVEPHISLGEIYLREGQAANAVNELERARSLDPRANSAYSHLAKAYRELGKTEEAKEVLLQLKNLVDQERTVRAQPDAKWPTNDSAQSR